MQDEKQILLGENEQKPNRYTASASVWLTLAALLVELLNELGVFHVQLLQMRICALTVVLCSLAVQGLGRKASLSGNPKTKYFILLLVLLETLSLAVMLEQWTELLIALPLLMATQYHNKHVTLCAVAGSALIALCSAPLSLLLGTLQADFYTFLLRALGYDSVLTPIASYDGAYYIGKVLLYIGLPRLIAVVALCPIILYLNRLVSGNIRDRVDAAFFSTIDVMTGLRNRLSYEDRLLSYRKSAALGLICVYSDANGLHEINSERGHAAGDTLLKCCASRLAAAFPENTFRIGGDEFVSFAEAGDVETVREQLRQIDDALAEQGFTMSHGVACLTDGQTVDQLVEAAEQEMFASKKAYYGNAINDRRR